MGIPVGGSQVSSYVRNSVSCVHILEPWRVTWEKPVDSGLLWELGWGLWGPSCVHAAARRAQHFYIKRRCQGNLPNQFCGGIPVQEQRSVSDHSSLHSQGYKEAPQHCHCISRHWALRSRWVWLSVVSLGQRFHETDKQGFTKRNTFSRSLKRF